MEHDRRCEKDGQVRAWEKTLGREDGFVHLLRVSEDLCACQARCWGMQVSLEVGIRISDKKAGRLWKAWQEVQAEGVEVMASRLAENINSRLNGSNVVHLQDYRDA